MDTNSITKLIENSPDAQRIFNAHIRQTEDSPIDGSRIRSLQYAKQRFDSLSKPMQRFVIWFDSLLTTALEIIAVRTGRPMERCKDLLEQVDEEALVLMAMLADRGDEAMAFTRFLILIDMKLLKSTTENDK